MRTSTLQYLYLQKPLTLVVLICLLTILPWIGTDSYSSVGVSYEAAVASSMIETGNWVLPPLSANEFAVGPPMVHWLIAAFSLPHGEVSELTSRLPSALALVVLTGFVLVFFGKRTKFHLAFVATLLMLSSLEVHRAGMATQEDMLFTMFVVLGLFQMYRWENALELRGLPFQVPAFFGCAALTKGGVGIVFPLFVLVVYLLMLRKYSLSVVLKAAFYIGLSSLFIPLLWYIAAWNQGGDAFLQRTVAQHLGHFFSIGGVPSYTKVFTEHELWLSVHSLIMGFMPWTLLLFVALFGIRVRKMERISLKKSIDAVWEKVITLEKVKLFSLVFLVCVLFFYCLSLMQSSVFYLPAFPFLSLFLADIVLFLTENRTRSIRFFGILMALWGLFVVSVSLLTYFSVIDLPAMAAEHFAQPTLLNLTESTAAYFKTPDAISLLIFFLLLFSLGAVVYQIFKNIGIKILYATIALAISLHMLMDAILLKFYFA